MGSGRQALPIAVIGEPDVISESLEALETELKHRPWRSDISVNLEVGGEPVASLRCGHLVRPPLDSTEPDVLIAFNTREAMSEVLGQVKEALAHGDLPRVLTALLAQQAVPAWAQGGCRSMEVTGARALARLLWSAWLAREGVEDERAASKESWAKEDLSQGWVIVHSVSPGIKERVALFQKELEQVPQNKPREDKDLPVTGAEPAPWFSELLADLLGAAEHFQEVLEPRQEETSASSAAASSHEQAVDEVSAEKDPEDDDDVSPPAATVLSFVPSASAAEGAGPPKPLQPPASPPAAPVGACAAARESHCEEPNERKQVSFAAARPRQAPPASVRHFL